MLTTEHECRINGLHIDTVEIKQTGISRTWDVEYIFVDHKNTVKDRTVAIRSKVHADQGNSWSKETEDLIKELLESMERDLINAQFKVPKENENVRNGTHTVEESDQI